MIKGALGGLNPSVRCAWRPKALQILPIVEADCPEWRAVLARDQCVAPWGLDSRALMMTCPTCSTPVTGACPSWARRPARQRRSANPPRRLRTVGSDIPTRRATSALDAPVEHSRTIRHLIASA